MPVFLTIFFRHHNWRCICLKCLIYKFIFSAATRRPNILDSATNAANYSRLYCQDIPHPDKVIMYSAVLRSRSRSKFTGSGCCWVTKGFSFLSGTGVGHMNRSRSRLDRLHNTGVLSVGTLWPAGSDILVRTGRIFSRSASALLVDCCACASLYSATATLKARMWSTNDEEEMPSAAVLPLEGGAMVLLSEKQVRERHNTFWIINSLNCCVFFVLE